ncbi:MAG: acetyl-CoA synthetase, partial [Gaiellaceae bacterium]|nr:acetyl-CoA synthetase [Gaiellaceae bacterium]
LPQRVVHGHVPGFRTVFDDGPRPGDVFWTPSDWSWIGALGEVALPVAFHGCPLVATAERFTVAMAYRVLAEHGITCPFLAPAVIRRMRADPPADPSAFRLRAVMTGGEALAPEARTFMEETFGCSLNDIFGQTEANHLAAGCATRFATPPGAIGPPVPGRRIAILDRDGAVLPPGQSGEIALAADDPIVMLGYWGRPDLTARKIVDGWVRLGDRGLLDADGFLRFEGRLDDLIKVSGIQVGAEEVEAVLLGHAAVAEAGVCAVARPEGGGDTVAAFVRLRPGAAVEPDELRALVRGRIGPHAAPKVVEFVDAFPTTSSGKIQRRELRRIYEEGPAVT